MSDFGKRADLLVHERSPFNAEPPVEALLDAPLTPLDTFYVRGHGPVPDIDPASWHVTVDGLVERELTFGLTDLRGGFSQTEVTATLQCAGNRRIGLTEVREIPGESPWHAGATATARWRGVPLRDLLAAAAPLPDAAYVALIGADRSDEPDVPQPYGISIPRDKAERPEVLLAWEMNGEPLPAVHGAPVRAVVPGYIGARSVKWLKRIELRADPWDGHFQAVAYRLLAPDEEPGPGVGLPLGEVAVNSAVLAPPNGAELAAGTVEVRGYAFAGGSRAVARVEVTADAGETWHHAELLDDLGRWAWRQWRAELDLGPGEHVIQSRAWDSAAATQPQDPAELWNPKGYVNNSWGRVDVRVR